MQAVMHGQAPDSLELVTLHLQPPIAPRLLRSEVSCEPD